MKIFMKNWYYLWKKIMDNFNHLFKVLCIEGDTLRVLGSLSLKACIVFAWYNNFNRASIGHTCVHKEF